MNYELSQSLTISGLRRHNSLPAMLAHDLERELASDGQRSWKLVGLGIAMMVSASCWAGVVLAITHLIR